MLRKRMNKTFLFLLWNFMHFKLCSHVTKTELIIGHSGPRVGSCLTPWGLIGGHRIGAYGELGGLLMHRTDFFAGETRTSAYKWSQTGY